MVPRARLGCGWKSDKIGRANQAGGRPAPHMSNDCKPGIHALALARHQPIPPAIAYPADYGLARATYDLIWQYGKDGAINRLIEMAERIAAGEKPDDWVLRRRRVDPTERIIGERHK